MLKIIGGDYILNKYAFVLIAMCCLFLACQNMANQEIGPQNSLHGNIVYENGNQILIYDIDTKKSRSIYSNKNIGLPMDPEWSNDGIYIGLFGDINHSNKSCIAEINREGKYLRKIFDSSNAVKPSVSYDGSKMAFLCGDWSNGLGRIDYKLCIANIDGSDLIIIDLPLYSIKPAWSPNGRDVAVTDVNNDIQIVNHQTRLVNKVTKGTAPSFSPDGKSLAFLRPEKSQANSRRSDLILLDLLTMKEHPLIENYYFGAAPKWTPQWSSDGKFIIYAYFGKIFLPPERQIVEAYSLEHKKSFKLFEVNNQITGFSYKQKNNGG